MSLFADDTLIVRAVDTEDDVEELQSDLDRIYSWQEENNMEFNSKKFEVMRYERNISSTLQLQRLTLNSLMLIIFMMQRILNKV